jgi:hypothetical protein
MERCQKRKVSFLAIDTSREEMRKEYDFEFIAKAKEAIKEGGKVFYTCWW